jgi:hypothetical protein
MSSADRLELACANESRVLQIWRQRMSGTPVVRRVVWPFEDVDRWRSVIHGLSTRLTTTQQLVQVFKSLRAPGILPPKHWQPFAAFASFIDNDLGSALQTIWWRDTLPFISALAMHMPLECKSLAGPRPSPLFSPTQSTLS